MKRCLVLLEAAVAENQASAINLAYLSDRIATFEGKAQKYGTAFDWDEDGLLSPQSYDDLAKVNQRRRELGLNSLEEQTAVIRERAKKENETKPKDFLQRQLAMLAWRRKVGWIV